MVLLWARQNKLSTLHSILYAQDVVTTHIQLTIFFPLKVWEKKNHTPSANIYTLWREIFAGQNFCRTKFSWIGHWQRFREKNFKATPTLGVSNHTHITRESAVMASEFSI